MTNSILVKVSASRVGDTTVMIHDAAGARVAELPVHVRNPDRLDMHASCAGAQCLPEPTLRVLRGETVPLGGVGSFGERVLPGAPALAIDADPDGLVSLGERRDRSGRTDVLARSFRWRAGDGAWTAGTGR